MASRKLTRGDIDGLIAIYSECILLSVFISAAAMLLLFGFSDPVAILFGARGNSAYLLDLTVSYLRGLTFGFPALMLNSLVSVALQFDNGEREIRNAYLAGMAVDIILDIVAVKIGAGLFGVGLASTISAFSSLAALSLHFLEGKGRLKFRPVRLSFSDIKEILYLGSERAFYRMLSFVRSLIINPFVIAVGGTTAMAALSVRNSIMNFVAIPGYGIADGVSVGADIAYNMRSRSDLKETGSLAHKYAKIFSLIPGILICVFAFPISKYYWRGNTEDGQRLLAFALIMGGIKLLGETLLTARVSYLQAIRKIPDAQRLLFAYNFISVIVCVLVMGLAAGSYGIMAAFTVSDAAVMVGIVILYIYTNKKMKITPDDYMKVINECDAASGDVIELDIRDLEDCAMAGEQVELFCRGHKLEKKQGVFAGLCTEEALTIALSIAQKGIKKKEDDKSSDVRLYTTIAQGRVRIHIRYYCRGVSLLKEIQRVRDEQGEAFFDQLGKQIIDGLSFEIKTFNSMDIDNWIIII